MVIYNFREAAHTLDRCKPGRFLCLKKYYFSTKGSNIYNFYKFKNFINSAEKCIGQIINVVQFIYKIGKLLIILYFIEIFITFSKYVPSLYLFLNLAE